MANMVKDGTDFIVYDAKTGEDITRSVLTQIIFEEENKEGNNLLPINFLRQLIRFYGNSMQGMVPNYLEFSMGNLMKDQDKLRKQMPDAFGGGDPFKMMEEAAKRNMQMFQDSMKMFTPFAAPGFANSSRDYDEQRTAIQTNKLSKLQCYELKFSFIICHYYQFHFSTSHSK